MWSSVFCSHLQPTTCNLLCPVSWLLLFGSPLATDRLRLSLSAEKPTAPKQCLGYQPSTGDYKRACILYATFSILYTSKRIEVQTSMHELEKYFRGLADTTRLRILNLLTWGELCGCDIQRVLAASQANVSRHLTYLKHTGLVRDRREGFRVFYQLAESTNPTIHRLFEFLSTAFARDENFRTDLRQLKEAIKDGICALPLARLSAEAPATGSTATAHRSQHRSEVSKSVRSPKQSRVRKPEVLEGRHKDQGPALQL
jgi:ArsR family transcriptional regulator